MGISNILGFSKLQKLTIVSFDKIERGGKGKEVEVMFNPESIQQNFRNSYTRTKEGKNTTYKHRNVSSVSMKLIFDGTGVHQYGHVIGLNALEKDFQTVKDRVDDFLEHAIKINGETHQPPFLTLSWGKTLDFKCRVGSLDINYTMFDKSGDPLRAELSLSFVEDDSLVVKKKKDRLESPDLTHYRIVKQGDQLPLMCNDIYGSPNFYPLVAKANKLTDFRNLTPGQEIYFPPIEK